MKKILLATFLSLSLFAQADKIEYVNEMSILLGDSENGAEQNMNRSLAYQMQFQYNGLDFPIKPEIDFVYSQDIPLYINNTETHTRYSLLMVNGLYEIPYSDLLTPYVKAGVGYISLANIKDSPKSTPIVDAGAGVKLNLTDRWGLKFDVVTLVGKESHFNIIATAGITFKFGRKYVAPPAEKVCEPCEDPKIVPVIKAPTKVFTPQTIKFQFAKATLTNESKSSFKAYADELNNAENRNKNILIIGNTDSKGTRAFNATLSIKRANAVRAELIANGVDASRISIDGLGEINPIADNETELGREKNRRVIIILTEKERPTKSSDDKVSK